MLFNFQNIHCSQKLRLSLAYNNNCTKSVITTKSILSMYKKVQYRCDCDKIIDFFVYSHGGQLVILLILMLTFHVF